MTWDTHDSNYFFGNPPVDMNSPPAIGESAKITKDGYEFEVRITGISGVNLSGVVERIGPQPTIQAADIARGEVVTFQAVHIHTLYR